MLQLEHEIKRLIIDVLQLEDINPDDIDSGAPLFVEGLGLDSIDALELGVALQKRYGIALRPSRRRRARHFASVRGPRRFRQTHRTQVAEGHGSRTEPT